MPLLHDRPVRELWEAPQLLLSQCCGYDVAFGYRDRLLPLLTTDWSAPGCEPGQYRNWVVVAADSLLTTLEDLSGCTAVINGRNHIPE
ncbi:MAG: hypothetical protein R3E95_07620 [Thiolinea sp.]